MPATSVQGASAAARTYRPEQFVSYDPECRIRGIQLKKPPLVADRGITRGGFLKRSKKISPPAADNPDFWMFQSVSDHCKCFQNFCFFISDNSQYRTCTEDNL